METTETKTYKIDGRNFQLRNNLTLRERDSIASVMRKFRFMGGAITSELKLQELCNFFAVILKPTDGEKVEPSSFENLNEQTEIEVVSDFFIQRIDSTANLMEYLKTWQQNLKESKTIFDS